MDSSIPKQPYKGVFPSQFKLWLASFVNLSNIENFTSNFDGHIWITYSKTVMKFWNKLFLLVKLNSLTGNFQAAASY